MSKIIFFDIDGTLYDSRIGIPESTVNDMELAKKPDSKS